jgi:hypothetical protein
VLEKSVMQITLGEGQGSGIRGQGLVVRELAPVPDGPLRNSQAAEKGLPSGNALEMHPPGAKAHVDLIGLIGTAKVVPFQD